MGVAALLTALVVSLTLIRLRRTLAILEITLLRIEESMTQVVPEVRGSLGNVTEITTGVNVALQVAGQGANRLGAEAREAAGRSRRSVSATLYGVGVAAGSLLDVGRRGPVTVVQDRVSGGGDGHVG